MHETSLLLHELKSLESSFEVLKEAAQAVCGPLDHIEFLRAEVPLAIEDAERALDQIRRMAREIEKAA
ncbi:MAG: hypothetical protein AAF829_08645 [Pseudomonadota bacterium]